MQSKLAIVLPIKIYSNNYMKIIVNYTCPNMNSLVDLESVERYIPAIKLK